jgi:L-glyceraldehyde 3-phosphate reductase
MTDMQYRRCGASGLVLPAVSLGAWANLGEPGGEAVARSCILRAFDLGVTHFDLANNYGVPPGNAETVCGAILAELRRDEYVVATKAGYPMWGGPYGSGGSRKHIIASCDQSLARLGLEYVDIFYSHRPDPDTPIDETVGALAALVDQGKTLYVGLSSYLGAQHTAAVEAARRSGVPITIVQPYYNLLGRAIEAELVPRLAGAGIIAFAPLASGLLTGKYLDGRDPSGDRAGIWPGRWVRSHSDQERVRILNGLHEMAAARGQTLAQMAIAWALRLPEMTSVVVGASRPEQVEQDVASLDRLDFADDELTAIDALVGTE